MLLPKQMTGRVGFWNGGYTVLQRVQFPLCQKKKQCLNFQTLKSMNLASKCGFVNDTDYSAMMLTAKLTILFYLLIIPLPVYRRTMTRHSSINCWYLSSSNPWWEIHSAVLVHCTTLTDRIFIKVCLPVTFQNWINYYWQINNLGICNKCCYCSCENRQL